MPFFVFVAVGRAVTRPPPAQILACGFSATFLFKQSRTRNTFCYPLQWMLAQLSAYTSCPDWITTAGCDCLSAHPPM